MNKLINKTMEDKIKWFGRYLGVEIQMTASNKNICTPYIIHSLAPWVKKDKCKLILKELEDITDEDLKGLISYMRYNYDGVKINRYSDEIRADLYVDQDDLYSAPWVSFSIYFNQETYDYQIVDFLRSKGYAIGIPKEYYITEKETNET